MRGPPPGPAASLHLVRCSSFRCGHREENCAECVPVSVSVYYDPYDPFDYPITSSAPRKMHAGCVPTSRLPSSLGRRACRKLAAFCPHSPSVGAVSGHRSPFRSTRRRRLRQCTGGSGCKARRAGRGTRGGGGGGGEQIRGQEPLACSLQADILHKTRIAPCK